VISEMTEYLVKFVVIKNQKVINHKTYRVDKKKYEMIKHHTKKLLKGVSQKQNARYSRK